MRLGVVRGDLPGPLLIGDVEPISQHRAPVEPRGQERYVGRPTVAEVEAVLAHATTGAGATIQGSDIAGSFPLTIDGTNDDLRIRTSAAASFTVLLVPQAVYASLTTLLAALNTVLTALGVTARQGTGSGSRVALEGPHGVSSYVEIDSVANGSVANTPLGLGAAALARTMPAAATYITALNPVAGVLDVSVATISGVGASTNSSALSLVPTSRGTHENLADAIAPQFIETTVAVESFMSGHIFGYLSSSFNPDSRRGLPSGAAVSAVQDDGVSLFTAPLPNITLVVLAGTVTITGVGLGSFDSKETVVQLVTGQTVIRLDQVRIEQAGGSVSATSIVVPASLVSGLTLATLVRVQVRGHVSSQVSINSLDVVLGDTMAATDSAPTVDIL